MARGAGGLPNRPLLNISTQYLYFAGEKPIPLGDHHAPYCWAFAPPGGDLGRLRRDLLSAMERHRSEAVEEGNGPAAAVTEDEEGAPAPPPARRNRGQEAHPLAKILRVGEPEERRSFVDAGRRFDAFRVYARRSWFTPEISDELFFSHGLLTGEHDIPYHQRACVDLAAEGKAWAYDTKGRTETLKVLVYDIETTQYGDEEGPAGSNIPVDVIGHSAFEVKLRSSAEVADEEFEFSIVDCPTDWQAPEFHQLVAHDEGEEIENLHRFTQHVRGFDIVSGHNILGFDNRKVRERIETLLPRAERQGTIEPRRARELRDFLSYWSAKDTTYQFGRPDEIAHLYPTGLDTLLAARRFYFYLDDFSLKGLAPFLGIHVPGRIRLSPDQMALDDRTLRYNEHDVREQLGVTMNIVNQALPLAFTTGSPFELLFSGLNTKMWDHMALIRAAHHKRLMPATCRAQGVATTISKRVGPEPTRDEIVRYARTVAPDERGRDPHKEFLRVAKYGQEMPDWVQYPHLIVDPDATGDDRNPYAIPGGMTLHPQDLNSHFLPWWHVVAADVGAMYPTILKALNVGADTVRICGADEEPDEWVWLYKVSDRLAKSRRFRIRPVGPTEPYAKTGWMVGVKKSPEPGTVNLAMTAIMKMIAKVKRDLAEKKRPGANTAPAELKRLQLNYQSLKAARNAGTHGILVAVNVSCRQFNVLAGAHITTMGQQILHDTLRDFDAQGIRTVYGDTDGIYLACSRSGALVPSAAKALQAPSAKAGWITKPDVALQAVARANDKWRKVLNYPDFELEPEVHDCMVFVVHKNYLIFDWHDGTMRMETKGNNFKGSDKADLARTALKDIMERTLKENIEWSDEEAARSSLKASIKRNTREVVAGLNLLELEQNVDDLILLQTVQPAGSYKTNPDGTPSVFAKRSEALGKLLGSPIRASKKFKFVVTNKPLPGLETAGRKKPGIKPYEFMFPVEELPKHKEYKIDLGWYKEMIEQYVRGAFGLDDFDTKEQKGLDQWL